ncbi:MAG: hypothetical protein M3M96_06865, partial [Candidatus Eremiobacteraeota bacterium]|nr:hypothetical protein [Candidatus Eremiobacteraeota bacterium]
MRETVEHFTIARIEHHSTPTPSPTPSPAPAHVVSRSHIVPVPSQAKIVVPAPVGKSAPKAIVKRIAAARPKPPHIVHAKPIWDIPVPTGGQGAGAGNASGAGSVGNGGIGSGAGDRGSGSGGGGAPCGAVDFSSRGEAHYNEASGFYERENISATVHFEDGSSQSVPLDWT